MLTTLKRIRIIAVGIALAHVAACEAIAIGWWRPEHIDGFAMLTFFSVMVAIPAIAAPFVYETDTVK